MPAPLAALEIPLCTQMQLEHAPGSFALAQAENPSNIPHDVARLHMAEAAGRITKKWAPGRTLRVRFLDGDAAAQAEVERIAREWERYASVRFAFGDSASAELRITFSSLGSWSYIGTDALGVPVKLATMQLAHPGDVADADEYRHIVLHEFGHALGLQHEHQNPSGGVPWDKPKVYAYYRQQDPAWDDVTVDAKVLAPLERNSTNYSAFDPDSVMQYAIPAALTAGGYQVEANAGLSQTDRDFISRTWYPHPHTDLGVAHSTVVSRRSDQLDLFWIAPDGAVCTISWSERGAWSEPTTVAAAGSAHVGAIAAVARDAAHLDVFWVAPDGSVRTAWWHEGMGWSGAHMIVPAGSADPGAIAALARRTDRLDVFWISADGSVRSVTWRDGPQWSAPSTIAEPDAAHPGAIHAVARASNHVDLFWVTQAGELASAWWHEGEAWSVPFTIAGPGTVEPGSIAGVARRSDHVDVFWTNPEGAIVSAAWHEGTKWSAAAAVTPPNSSRRPGGVRATARRSNHLDLFWVSPDGAIMSAWWHEDPPTADDRSTGADDADRRQPVGEPRSAAWSPPFRLTPFGVAEERSLSGVARVHGHLDLCWVAFDGAVLATSWHEGQAWKRPFGVAGVGSAAT